MALGGFLEAAQRLEHHRHTTGNGARESVKRGNVTRLTLYCGDPLEHRTTGNNMEGTEREGVQHLDGGRDERHNRGRHLGLLANVSRSNKCSDSLPSSAPSAVLSLEPLGRRDAALPGPAHLTVSTRTTMPYQNAIPAIRHSLPRDVYTQPFGSGHVHFFVTSDGTQGCYRFRTDDETDDDVIEALADELDRVDPLPQPSLRRFALPGSASVPPSRPPSAARREGPAAVTLLR